MPDDEQIITLDGRRVLLLEQAARRAGIGERTWSSWLSRGWPRSNPVPQPDARINRRTPVWWPETIDAWMSRRPSAR